VHNPPKLPLAEGEVVAMRMGVRQMWVLLLVVLQEVLLCYRFSLFWESSLVNNEGEVKVMLGWRIMKREEDEGRSRAVNRLYPVLVRLVHMHWGPVPVLLVLVVWARIPDRGLGLEGRALEEGPTTRM
jgi:hypothetical protein